MLEDLTIGFLGAGSMAEALVHGLLGAGLTAPDRIWVTNRSNRERLGGFARRFGVHVTPDKAQVVERSHVLVIACKPKDVAGLLAEVGRKTRPGQIALSVAAGISTEALAAGLTPGVQVVRAMPNTSSQIRESATALCGGPGATPEAVAVCRAILGAVGKVVEVPEPLLDAVTGLSGSGPAYVYAMVEALVEAGVRAGLPREVSHDLAVQTVLGAARMLVETREDPAVLRQKVTSPGGTTMAGLQVLSEHGFHEAIVRAVSRAAERSRELGLLLASAPGAD
ncbi:pyrroline-5-carboxylate reductase [Caldinitratiruptor microaerophilus]|uniref:Pyrroline-5-carboxylate reductase n=1 Tax=Caldinitratiruptor microaerophilus TaxID=671077 RepID=A0AA35CK80_9FIRM|nr:pyrroline-5-carboxylate reductase [Caldinitratiruptor microaerophilus]BDG60839.1 pyrroline-5-carboxylate reductase [Caldinitratiruptor microaerophilus]